MGNCTVRGPEWVGDGGLYMGWSGWVLGTVRGPEWVLSHTAGTWEADNWM